jgi:Helix-hairpin-helix motif
VPAPRPEPEGLGWAFIPVLTCGFGTAPAFVYAAFRSGSPRYGAVAVGYGAATSASIVFLSVLPPLGALLLMITWIVGGVHAFAVRPKLYPPRTPRDRLNQHAVDAARYRRVLRAEARKLVADDPGLAHDLGIGRPDLQRVYDDGGLIDVNHAPSQVLATLPGMTDELVERIVELRSEHGTFVSAEELALDAELPPDVVPGIAEYGIFLP